MSDEAADADSDCREQLLAVKGLRLRQQHVLEEVQALVAQGDISTASGAQQAHQELEDEISAAESVLADLKAAAQQLHSDSKAAGCETERLHHRVFLCTCVVQFVHQSRHWEGQWKSWQQCAEQAHCQASQQHRARNERASYEVIAICMQSNGTSEHAIPNALAGSTERGHSQLEQEAQHAEHEASNALSEMRKSLNVADLLHSCMLSLSNSDELIVQCSDTEQALNAALLHEQNCKAMAEQVHKSVEAEFERVCAHLATAGSPGLLPMLVCFEALSEQSNESREQLYSASVKVREIRATLQKLQIQQHACLHMEQLVCVAHGHDSACQRLLDTNANRSSNIFQRQLKDKTRVLPDSRESTLTVAEGIPRLATEERDPSIASLSSEACRSSPPPDKRLDAPRSAVTSNHHGKVCCHQLYKKEVVSMLCVCVNTHLVVMYRYVYVYWLALLFWTVYTCLLGDSVGTSLIRIADDR